MTCALRSLGVKVLALAILLWSGTVLAQTTDATATQETDRVKKLKQLSLEELTKVQVTSVSRSERTVAESPAAVFVVTGEDIRRSGAISVAEALRYVPGVEVARVDARLGGGRNSFARASQTARGRHGVDRLHAARGIGRRARPCKHVRPGSGD